MRSRQGTQEAKPAHILFQAGVETVHANELHNIPRRSLQERVTLPHQLEVARVIEAEMIYPPGEEGVGAADAPQQRGRFARQQAKDARTAHHEAAVVALAQKFNSKRGDNSVEHATGLDHVSLGKVPDTAHKRYLAT